MAAGLQVWGDHGFVQISDSYSNLVYRSKHTVTLYGNGEVLNGTRGTIDISAVTPMLGIVSGFMVGLQSCYSIGTNLWRCEFLSGGNGGQFTLYVFDQQVGTGGNVGMQVFRGDGALIFDTNNRYARIKGVVRRPAGAPGYGSTWSWSGLASSTYAVMYAPRSGVYAIPETDTIFIMDMVQHNPNGVTIGLYPYGNRGIWDQGDGIGMQVDASTTSDIVMIDVAGL